MLLNVINMFQMCCLLEWPQTVADDNQLKTQESPVKISTKYDGSNYHCPISLEKPAPIGRRPHLLTVGIELVGAVRAVPNTVAHLALGDAERGGTPVVTFVVAVERIEVVAFDFLLQLVGAIF